MNDLVDVSFRCFFPGDQTCNHYQTLPLADIGKWIDCYRFTHPACLSISVKVWFHSQDL